MYKLILITFLLVGCAGRTPCEMAIDNLQPSPKIPKIAALEINDTISADEGGQELLKNYVILSNSNNSMIQSCSKR